VNSLATNLNEPDFSRGADGLLPSIAQDARTHRVLMLAWMNRDAFLETRRTGLATYFSRSRRRLWRKGEESGHIQKVIEMRIDCDADTILLLVEQQGAACHEGYASCFFRTCTEEGFVENQSRLMQPESIYPPSQST
jgi:phosphoribosyl-AMP cyclohydrolase